MAANPYTAILKKLAEEGVRYVVVGVTGINFYSDDPGRMISTEDLDIAVEPTVVNLLAAFKTLEAQAYRLEINGEPLVGVDRLLAKRIVEHRAAVTARKGNCLRVDLVLEAGKQPYRAWEKSSRIFKLRGCKVRVGELADLLRAKADAGREKDKKFLALYGAQIKEMLREAGASKGGRRP